MTITGTHGYRAPEVYARDCNVPLLIAIVAGSWWCLTAHCESVSARERQDKEQMPREVETRQGRTPPTGDPHRGDDFAEEHTTVGEGHTGDPHRTHTDMYLTLLRSKRRMTITGTHGYRAPEVYERDCNAPLIIAIVAGSWWCLTVPYLPFERC